MPSSYGEHMGEAAHRLPFPFTEALHDFLMHFGRKTRGGAGRRTFTGFDLGIAPSSFTVERRVICDVSTR